MTENNLLLSFLRFFENVETLWYTYAYNIYDKSKLFQTIPVAMAGLRNAHGICPPEVIKFLLDLFKYNDNSKNKFSDNYYRASLIEALGETITPVISVVQHG